MELQIIQSKPAYKGHCSACGTQGHRIETCGLTDEQRGITVPRMRAARVKRYRARLRIDALLAYGGQCFCCGYNNLDKKLYGKSFLEIDHVDGGGRRHLDSLQGRQIYPWLKKNKYPTGFRVLCAGCNHAIEPGAAKCLLHKDL